MPSYGLGDDGDGPAYLMERDGMAVPEDCPDGCLCDEPEELWRKIVNCSFSFLIRWIPAESACVGGGSLDGRTVKLEGECWLVTGETDPDPPQHLRVQQTAWDCYESCQECYAPPPCEDDCASNNTCCKSAGPVAVANLSATPTATGQYWCEFDDCIEPKDQPNISVPPLAASGVWTRDVCRAIGTQNEPHYEDGTEEIFTTTLCGRSNVQQWSVQNLFVGYNTRGGETITPGAETTPYIKNFGNGFVRAPWVWLRWQFVNGRGAMRAGWELHAAVNISNPGQWWAHVRFLAPSVSHNFPSRYMNASASVSAAGGCTGRGIVASFSGTAGGDFLCNSNTNSYGPLQWQGGGVIGFDLSTFATCCDGAAPPGAPDPRVLAAALQGHEAHRRAIEAYNAQNPLARGGCCG